MKVTLKNGIFDRVYLEQGATHQADTWDGTFPEGWTWATRMDAKFEQVEKTITVIDPETGLPVIDPETGEPETYTVITGDLQAGTADVSYQDVAELRIKRREKGQFEWKTLYVRAIDAETDFQFDWWDYTARGNHTYEYAVVPLLSTGLEGAVVVHEVDSEFHDFFMFEPGDDTHETGLDMINYRIIANTSNSITYNQETSTQTAFGRKYPYVIKNGNIGYYSGSFSGTWVQLFNCDFDWENGVDYRLAVDQFLSNGNPKILKDWMGHIFMISVVDTIPQDSSGYYLTPIHQISWTECGDAGSVADLYDNNFINTEIDRE